MSDINLVSVTNENVKSIDVEISNFTNSVDIELGQNFSAALNFHNQDITSHRYILEKLAGKVEIEANKGLSQNDLTDELKNTYDNYQNSISDIQSDISDIQENLTSLGNSIPEIATENQAVAGIDDTTMMTPLKVLRSIQENAQLSVQAYITEIYQNGASGYRIWSDGWCEQWGSVAASNTQASITLIKAYKDANYQVYTQQTVGSAGSTYITNMPSVYIQNSSTFILGGYNGSGYSNRFWTASGYLAEGEY